MFALHTVNANPASTSTFQLMQAYRAVCRQVPLNGWDEPLPFVSRNIRAAIDAHLVMLAPAPPVPIAPTRTASYCDDEYDVIIFSDASADGWGAFVKVKHAGVWATHQYQQRWVNHLGLGPWNAPQQRQPFTARYSAHTEPEAVTRLLQHLALHPETKTAIVSDHFAITHAQRRLNGFGGIGRGQSLNRMYAITNPMNIIVFYIPGQANPADPLSRNFGANRGHEIVEGPANDICLPFLRSTYCPLAEGQRHPEWMK